MFIAAIAFILLSKIIKIRANNLKKKHKIQDGNIIYSDLNKPEKSFFSKKYRIAGKPDYITKKDKKYIPIEFKTSRANRPQLNHILQLAAYCHLLEENYGGFVPYGILIYNSDTRYTIPFDPKLRFELESSIIKIRNAMKSGKITLNHNDFYRCKSCSMRNYCNTKIS
jgi:CRISPR-associated exonuclease Cas4